MSGIYGCVSQNTIDKNVYKGLSLWNNSYGDCNTQEYYDENAFLGIKPEALKNCIDNKRIITSAGRVGVFDALIYSDTETGLSDEYFLSDQICKKGLEALAHINGDFSGALWNNSKKELTLFRDHLGVRPLFYYSDKDRVIFSTDIRGILSVNDIDVQVNEDWLFSYLYMGKSQIGCRTEYEHINCVPFGGWITFQFTKQGIIAKEGHYYIPGKKKYRMKSKEAYTKELRRLVEDAVHIRANATNLKIGAELSGGLDSGIIDLILAKSNKECLYYSWSPAEDKLAIAENDERLIVKDICEKAGITCNFGGLAVNLDTPMMAERFPLGKGNYDKVPAALTYAFPPYVNTASIFETASFMKDHGVKFVFTGHGGDEGVSHRSNPYELFYFHEYYRYLRLMYSRSSISKHRIFKTIKLIYDNQVLANKKLKAPFFAKHIASDVLKSDFTKKYENEKIKPLAFAYDPIEYVIEGGSRNRLDVLAFFSSCTGTRYLIPYLDYRVLDFALGIPRYLYHNWYINRYIFREAFKDLMPHSLYTLKTKEDFSYRNLPKISTSEYEKSRVSNESIERRKMYLGYLDKNYWQKYLNFEILEDWVYGRNKTEDDERLDRAIFTCLQLEHLVKRSREVNS